MRGTWHDARRDDNRRSMRRSARQEAGAEHSRRASVDFREALAIEGRGEGRGAKKSLRPDRSDLSPKASGGPRPAARAQAPPSTLSAPTANLLRAASTTPVAHRRPRRHARSRPAARRRLPPRPRAPRPAARRGAFDAATTTPSAGSTARATSCPASSSTSTARSRSSASTATPCASGATRWSPPWSPPTGRALGGIAHVLERSRGGKGELLHGGPPPVARRDPRARRPFRRRRPARPEDRLLPRPAREPPRHPSLLRRRRRRQSLRLHRRLLRPRRARRRPPRHHRRRRRARARRRARQLRAQRHRPGARTRFDAEDAFAWLERAARERRRYGLVVTDPPSFAPSEKALQKGAHRLS